MINLGKYKILESQISACDYEWIIKEIFSNLKKKIIIAPVASHPITLGSLDKKYQTMLGKIDFLLPDSQWVKWALWFLYGINLKDRVYGPELMERILKKVKRNEIKLLFIGNNRRSFLKAIKQIYPNVKTSKFINLEGKKIDDNLIKEINSRISRYKFDLLFIGIGSPNQHLLAVNLDIKKPIICVGAAFDFISGVKKQAPKWMGDWGLEWLFRLINEPRLLKRYLIYGVLFTFLVLWRKLISLSYKE